jgi:hypothetical protein
MNDDFEKRRSHIYAVTEFAAKTGPAWVEEFKSEFSKLPTGTVVAINCVTGEYVTGTGLSEASEAFERRFGKSVGWIHEIGGGFFVGGGLVSTRLLRPHHLKVDFGHRTVTIESRE